MATKWGFMPVTDPAFFASYSNSDSKRAGEVAKGLYDMDYPVWYDAGLEAGTKKWNAQISTNIERSYALILFITKGIFKRSESYVTIEYDEAKALGKPIIPVFLDDIELKDIEPQYRSYLIEWRKLHGVDGVGKEPKEVAAQIAEVIKEDGIEYVKRADSELLSTDSIKLRKKIRRHLIAETVADGVFVLGMVSLILYSLLIDEEAFFDKRIDYKEMFIASTPLFLAGAVLFIIALAKNIDILRKEKKDARILYSKNNQIHYLLKSDRSYATFPFILVLFCQLFISHNSFSFESDVIDYSEIIMLKNVVILTPLIELLIYILYIVLHCVIWNRCNFSLPMRSILIISGVAAGLLILFVGFYKMLYIFEFYVSSKATGLIPFIISNIFYFMFNILFISQAGIISKMRKFG